MSTEYYDFVVLGGGPGGYVAAIRAAQTGKTVALVEKNELGGTCLNRGCIPTKTLLASADVLRKAKEAKEFGVDIPKVEGNFPQMMKRKDQVVKKMLQGLGGLIKANAITLVTGEGHLSSSHVVKVKTKEGTRALEGKSIILATGSEPKEIPAFPVDGKHIHNSSTLLQLKKPPKSLAIIGGGVIGAEFASFFHEIGVEVTIIEALDQLLPLEGKEVAKALANSFTKRGISIHLQEMVKDIQVKKGSIEVSLTKGSLEAEMALVAVGRSLNTEGIGLESVGIETDSKGCVCVNDTMQTSLPHVYAIGDITGKMLLAHVASHQGIVAVDHALGRRAKMHYEAIPSVTYTHPEVATVGMSIEEAKRLGHEVSEGTFPFQALGKAQAALETEGFAQVITDKKTGQILGASVIGHEASSLIAEMALAINNELTDECLVETVHAHPTIAEAWLEAGLLAMGTPLHLPPKRQPKKRS